MAEKSIMWTTGATGDGASPYTQAEAIRMWRQMFISDTADEGVHKNYGNELAVTGTATPVAVNTGAAIVYGFPYWNTASVDVAIPTPAVSTRVDYITLEADWTAQTVRITRVAGTEGAGTPALTQTDGVEWQIPLATASITTGGVITVTDARVFLHPNIEIENAMIAADAITGAEIADDAIDSEHYADGSIDLAHLSADSVDATKIVNRTRTLWVPAVCGWNETDSQDAEGFDHGWGTEDAHLFYVYGTFSVPSDFVSGMTAKAIVNAWSAGNLYCGLEATYGAAGEAPSGHTHSFSVAAVTVSADQWSEICSFSLSSAAIGDYVQLLFSRNAVDVLDTVDDWATVLGFLVSYTADS